MRVQLNRLITLGIVTIAWHQSWKFPFSYDSFFVYSEEYFPQIELTLDYSSYNFFIKP